MFPSHTWFLGLLCLSVALTGCGQTRAAADPTALPIPPATASPAATAVLATPTLTATAIPTATETPPATATPAPTATPPPPTATPRPLPTRTATPKSPAPRPPVAASPLSVEPRQVAQGKTALIRVRTGPGQQAQGALDGAPLVFVPVEGEAWAVVGIPGLAKLGPRAVQVRLTDTAGKSVTHEQTLEVVTSDWPVEDITLPPGQGDLLAPDTVIAERNLLQTLGRQSTTPPRWQGTFLQPADGPESSPFGIRRSYNGGPPTGQHEGMDFAVNSGAPIRAAAAGTVVLARALQVRGNAVVLDHGAGVLTGYYHLSERLVEAGQEVGRGALIGKAGETGLATGPHLHWDLLIGGVNVDPAEWLERALP